MYKKTLDLINNIYFGGLFIINALFLGLFNLGLEYFLRISSVFLAVLVSYLYSVYFYMDFLLIENNELQRVMDIYQDKYKNIVFSFIVFFSSYIYSVMFSKLLLRVFPYRIEKLKLKFSINFSGLFFLTIILYLIYKTLFPAPVNLFQLFNSVFYQNFIFSNIFSEEVLVFTSSVIFFSFILFFIAKRSSKKEIDDIDYILYLRSFSGFSDRSVIIDISSAIKNILPLAFIMPLKNKIRDWDPLIISYSSFSFFCPYKNSHIHLVTDACDWEDNVKSLILKSKGVIIDISIITPSIEKEINLIVESKKLDSTLFISNSLYYDKNKLFLSDKKILIDNNFISYSKKINIFRMLSFMYFPFFILFLVDTIYIFAVYGNIIPSFALSRVNYLYGINIIFICYVIMVSFKKLPNKFFKKNVKNAIINILK